MQSNKDLIRQMWEAFTAGDRQKFFAVMADEIKFTVMGTTSLSLVTHGREEMIDRVLPPSCRGSGWRNDCRHRQHNC